MFPRRAMTDDSHNARDRLEAVLNSLFCPIAGCWPLHGCDYEYYFDPDAETHVLEIWPVGIDEPADHEGNGHQESRQGLLYELAEFDFAELANGVAIEHFHFSQRRALFEISWTETGQQLEPRLHIEPVEVAEDLG
jgi:hypothetical protein